MHQKKGQRFAGFQAQAFAPGADDAAGSLFLLGLPCTLHADAGTAAFIEEGRHLLPWFGDEGNLCDRWDARLL